MSNLQEARQGRNEPRASKRNSTFWPRLMLACAVVFAAPIVADRFHLLDRLQAFEWPTLQVGETIARLPVVITSSDAIAGVRSTKAAPRPQYRGPIPACSGGNRAKRRVTCIVDGDTGWQDGDKWRIANIDTPEISSPVCANEKRRGYAARNRLRTLMSRGYSLTHHGKGYYGRTLVTVTLADGRDAGDVLIAEGLSQGWPNSGNPWCR
ncbi:thermonuclease family protein [Aurantimonas sp. A2-1-M11]